MKAVLLALVVALAAAPRLPQTPPAGLSATGSIEVIVKRSGGAPLNDVDVTLSGPPLSSPLKITTGEDGRALFRNLQFGYYGVSAERQGYVWIRPYGAERAAADSLQLRPAPSGVTNQQSQLFLTPAGIISGKIVDSKGRPLRGISVTPAQAVYANGRRTFAKAYAIPYREGFRTDDLGEFRIFWLPPGEYYLLADRENPEPDHPDTYSPAMYYPGTTDFNSAAVVKLREGQEAQADIVLRIGEGVTISGTVVNPAPISFSNVRMYLNPVAAGIVSQLHSNNVAPVLKSPDTMATQFQFVIRGVPPGTYDLVTTTGSDDSHASSKNRVEVGNSNISGVVITPHTDPVIQGRFSISSDLRLFANPEAPPWAGKDAQLSATFAALDRLTDNNDDDFHVRTGEEGGTGLSFLTHHVLQSSYRIYSTQLPRDVYLVDLRQDGRSIFSDGIVEVGSDTVNLELVLGRNAGVISGRVNIPSAQDVPTSVAVVLIPDRPRRENPILYKRLELKVSTPGSTLAFSFSGIAPGSYRVFAWDHLGAGDEMNPEFLAQYELRGAAAYLEAGQSVTGIAATLIRTGK